MSTISRSFRPTALVVDDSKTQRRYLRVMLEAVGIEVDEAADGLTALDRLCCREYDVLILDLIMPVMGGLEVLKHLFETDQELPPPAVIVCSSVAKATLETNPEALRNAQGVLQKPTEPRELIQMVRDILEKNSIRSAS